MKKILLLALGLFLGFNTLFAKEASVTIKMTAYVEEIATVETKEISNDKLVLSLNSMNDAFGKITRTIENSDRINGESFTLKLTNTEDEIQVITVINS